MTYLTAIALGVALAVTMLVTGAVGGARADDDVERGVEQESGRVTRPVVPSVPMALGERCVEDTDFMRRNHMTLLMHQRERTVHQGLRTKKYSLRNCLSCHAPAHPANGAEPVSIESGKHFCAACHAYAAVKIDCFECHAETGGAE